MVDLLNAVPLKGEGEAGKNYRGPAIRKGEHSQSMLHISPFINRSLCTMLCSSHFANENQSFRFIVKTFSGSALAGGLKDCYHRGSSPLSAAMPAWTANRFTFTCVVILKVCTDCSITNATELQENVQGRLTQRCGGLRDVTQRIVVIRYRRFGTTCRSHL